MRNSKSPRSTGWLWLVVASYAAGALPTLAAEDTLLKGSTSYVVPEGETRVGDVYKFCQTARIAGTQDGDLTVWAQSVKIPTTGTVTGDLYAAASAVDIDGTVGDSARIAAAQVVISGKFQGDLLLFGADLLLTKEAHIAGDLHCYAGKIIMEGTVDGEFHAAGGEVTLNGKVAQDANIKCDALHVSEEARVGGDLDYVAREPVDLEGKGIVAGTVDYKEQKKNEEHDAVVSGWGIFKWLLFLVAATVIGLLALRIFREPFRAITGAVSGDMLRSAGVGFITVIVLPVAAAIACVLIITIPLVLIVILLYFVVLYLAKLPVAVWMGQRILGLLGRSDPSPYLSMFLGLVILHLLFVLPWVGWLFRLLCIFIGFGAIVMGIRSYVQGRRQGGTQGSPVSVEPAPATS
jgi:cytoskeletal protein CcmA (bactofilin family)